MLSLRAKKDGGDIEWTLTDSVTGMSATCDGNVFTETWIRVNAELLVARVMTPNQGSEYVYVEPAE